MDMKFGRVYKVDERDLDFPVSPVLPEDRPEIDKKKWWADGWNGDQGKSPHCVVYSWFHWFEDGPVIQNIIPGINKPIYDITEFYNQARLRDDIILENYEGTTVRAGAKILHKLGYLKEYRWATTIDEVLQCLTYLGPMVVGTNWYQSMFTPSSGRNIINPRGRNHGGHAYVINGIDHHNELLRIKNSWGRSWGDNGHAYIRFHHFEKLLNEWGEACIPFQQTVNSITPLNELPMP